ncbi:MAG: thiamine phosphate synthase [Thermoguttaceae bacterium]
MSKREIYRILDAAANRGREALRVVEDAARFLGDSQDLAAKLKETRHRFAIAADKLDRRERMLARDVVGDVGVNIETQDEYRRSSLLDVLVANFARLEESARSLEEFSKIVQPELAREWEQIRYAAYTLEKIAYQSATSFGLDAVNDDVEPVAPSADLRDASNPALPQEDETSQFAQEEASETETAPEPETPQDQSQEPSEAEQEEPVADEKNVAQTVAQTVAESVLRGKGNLRAARRAKLARSPLFVQMTRDLPTRELDSLLRSRVDAFELCYFDNSDARRAEMTEAFLRQWFVAYPNATRSIDDRPLLFSRDTSLWGEALDGWVVPAQAAYEARRVVGKDALVGVGVSNRDDVFAAIEAWNAGLIDFIEVGPVFNGHEGAQGYEFLRAFLNVFEDAPPMPIVAYGGIDEQNCHAVFDAGVERIAVSDPILTAPDKPAAVAGFHSYFEE